jgi:hypothetical protein
MFEHERTTTWQARQEYIRSIYHFLNYLVSVLFRMVLQSHIQGLQRIDICNIRSYQGLQFYQKTAGLAQQFFQILAQDFLYPVVPNHTIGI